MLKRTLATAGLLLITAQAVQAVADETAHAGWRKTADVGLALTQTGYSNSWEGSESGAITWTLTGNLTAEKQLNAKTNWLNTFKLLYGETHNQVLGDDGRRSWLSPEKSTDRLFLESLMKFTLGAYVDPYVALTVESQLYSEVFPARPDAWSDEDYEDFTGGNSPKRSDYLLPLLVTESAGIGKSIIAEEKRTLFTRLGFAVRQGRGAYATSVEAVTDSWDVKTESFNDGGLEWVTDYSHTFSEDRMKYVSKLRLFKALFNSESDALDAAQIKWETADIAWENTISASLSEYIQMSLFFELLYDEEISKKGRFREILGLGLSYKLF